MSQCYIDDILTFLIKSIQVNIMMIEYFNIALTYIDVELIYINILYEVNMSQYCSDDIY